MPLFEDARNRLAEILNLRNASYRPYKGRKIHELLPQFGYVATSHRKNNRTYFVITKNENGLITE